MIVVIVIINNLDLIIGPVKWSNPGLFLNNTTHLVVAEHLEISIVILVTTSIIIIIRAILIKNIAKTMTIIVIIIISSSILWLKI